MLEVQNKAREWKVVRTDAPPPLLRFQVKVYLNVRIFWGHLNCCGRDKMVAVLSFWSGPMELEFLDRMEQRVFLSHPARMALSIYLRLSLYLSIYRLSFMPDILKTILTCQKVVFAVLPSLHSQLHTIGTPRVETWNSNAAAGWWLKGFWDEKKDFKKTIYSDHNRNTIWKTVKCRSGACSFQGREPDVSYCSYLEKETLLTNFLFRNPLSRRLSIAQNSQKEEKLVAWALIFGFEES